MLDTWRMLTVCSGCPRPRSYGPQLIGAPAKAVSAPLAPSSMRGARQGHRPGQHGAGPSGEDVG